MKKKRLIIGIAAAFCVYLLAGWAVCPGIFPWNWNVDPAIIKGSATYPPETPHEHTFTAWRAEKGSCAELTESRFCSACGEYEFRTVNYPEHEGTWTIQAEPTAVSPGFAQRVCTRCGMMETKKFCPEGQHLGLNKTSIAGGLYVSGGRITYVDGTPVYQYPGTPSFVFDGQSFVISGGTSALPGTVTKPAGCTEAGEMTVVCAACGENVRVTLPELGHQCEQWTTVEEPCGCLSGEKKGVCRLCGEEMTETIPGTGHLFSQWQVFLDSTCEEEGSLRRVCEICEAAEFKPIPKIAHDFGTWQTVEEPTCLKTGRRECACTVCGEKKTETIPQTDHTYGVGQITVTPNCQKTGEKRYTCAVCGKTTVETLSKTGHTYGPWQTTVEPTCQQTGEKARTCTVCGEKETQALPLLNHRMGEWATVLEPGCLTAGEKCQYCQVGGEVIQRQTIPALGHDYQPTVPVSACTCGSEIEVCCTRCGDSYRFTVPELTVSLRFDGYATVISSSGSGTEYSFIAQAQGGFGKMTYQFELLKNGRVQLASAASAKSDWRFMAGFSQSPSGCVVKVTVRDEAGNVRETSLLL